MKKLVIFTTLATLALGAPYALSQTAPKAEKKPAPAASAPMDMDKLYADMQVRQKKMQEQMEKIRQAKDPKERQKLWEEHWKTMHEGMGMMGMMGMMMGRGPGGGGMMGGAMMGGPKGGPGMGPEAMQQRQEMMQMMMEHMMEQMNPSSMPGK